MNTISLPSTAAVAGSKSLSSCSKSIAPARLAAPAKMARSVRLGRSVSMKSGVVMSSQSVETSEETGLYPKAGWPTMDCPPQPRPELDAPPRYHGKPDLTSPGERVQVRVYMIDRFGMSRIGSLALKKKVDAIWHVSVVMFEREYNFSDKVAYMELGGTNIETETMHGFAPTHIYEVGNTLKTRDEIDKFCFGYLGREYGMENYCSFTHNCHNFANELTEFATGRKSTEGGFPQWCLDHGAEALTALPGIDAAQYKKVSNTIAKVMLVSFGKFNRDRVKKLTGKNWMTMDEDEVAALEAK